MQATSLTNATTNGAWSEGSLNAAGLAAVSKTTAANRPQLVVTYQ